ncbi:hypothetical protein KUV85_08995 [Nocardioides panacisoli]|uniref:DUF6174 domain-containing protein n=1 Tax=Nocardioides panacisoli TaxID=627624 RepID=UPI001C631CC1|nr:DUF6174 domain-containing protein [Nocardioides panacisoli]QYJ02476.1 hypothetical protein KUV85_08995 [Nocardioides panacisoli]
MRSALITLAIVALVAVGCSSEDAKTGSSGPETTGTPEPPTPSVDEDAFTETDYRYVLERSCYCPFTVPVTVTVADGEVTSAVARESSRTVKKGDPAPDSHRLTIADIIEIAEDPEQRAEVDWPDDQDWPDRVRTDQVEGAVDDEVTYVIGQVRIR